MTPRPATAEGPAAEPGASSTPEPVDCGGRLEAAGSLPLHERAAELAAIHSELAAVLRQAAH